MKPEHCKGCNYFHSAGRSNPTKELKKYNYWCCAKGDEAVKSVGWCKTHNVKK